MVSNLKSNIVQIIQDKIQDSNHIWVNIRVKMLLVVCLIIILFISLVRWLSVRCYKQGKIRGEFNEV